MELKEKDIQNLSTIQKILHLQRLLKEMTSIKERFMGNKQKMLKKLDSKCFTYYENKIYMKEIFDYCLSNKPEIHIEYQLIKDPTLYLKEKEYKSLYDFCFLIRNDYSLMLKIIELTKEEYYEELSDFFVNFLYVNIIKSSFLDDELMIMIFLLLDKFIFIDLPDKIDINKNISSYLKKNFLFHVFTALTRKIDLRNFLCSILTDFILRLINLITSLSVVPNIVNKYLVIKDRRMYRGFMRNMGSLKEEEIYRNKKKFKKANKNDIYFKQNTTTGNFGLKRTKRIVLGSSIVKFGNNNEKGRDSIQNLKTLEESLKENIEIPEVEVEEVKLEDKNKNYKKFEKRKTEIKNDDLQKKDSNLDKYEKIIDNLNLTKNKSETESKKVNVENVRLTLDKNKSENKSENKRKYNEDLDENGKVIIDKFFEYNSITKDKLKKYLLKYENKRSDKDEKLRINSAMKEYLNILISQIKDDKNNDKNNINNQDNDNNIIDDKEIFSNSLFIKELINLGDNKQQDSFRGLMRKIRFNHRIITRIILEIINKLKENLISSPYSLKCISKFINILLNKKYSNLAKNKLSDYQIFMFKINFLIGSIIIPIIKNPEFNGIVYTNVITNTTFENLKIISNILETIVEGKLFNNKYNPHMTIYNTFILDTIPLLFELVENFGKNFELPKNINNLINTYNNNDINKRNINYDYFKENPNENINYQSICFNYRNIYYLLQTIIRNKKILIDENQNKEEKLILQRLLDNQTTYILKYSKTFEKQEKPKHEFFYITKESYNELFEKKIKKITQDNFIYVKPKKSEDLITAFKKCINEVLNYANIIQIESFYELTERKDEKTFRKKSNKKSKKEDEKQFIKIKNLKIKKNIINSLKSSLIKIALADKEDDGDFKRVIFPQIKNNINFEINYNVDNDAEQRIIYCTTFLLLYMEKIPNNYKNNNYSLLFDELINETKNNIDYLKTSALFEFYKKIKEAEKLNMMNSSYSSQIKDLEKLKVIEYLYNKLLLPAYFEKKMDPNEIISNLKYISENNHNLNDKEINFSDYYNRKKEPIEIMIKRFPDFHKYEEEYDNILDIEEYASVPDAIGDYFSLLKKLVEKEAIIKRYNSEELKQILYDLENYILIKLYDNLFPFESTKEDIFIYKKCKRLGFIKPENIVKDKNVINEKLCEEAIQYFDDLDEKVTPLDKIKIFEKVFDIIQKSITFVAGKSNIGIEDIVDPLKYIIIKSKPKNIISNTKYCGLYLNSELSMSKYGFILNHFKSIIEHIQNMTYEDLIGVSEEKFGKDEIEN